MNQDFDIIIPIANNDIEALKRTLPYIKKQFSGKSIFIIANTDTLKCFRQDMELNLVDENEMIEGLDFSTVYDLIASRYPKATRRTGWYFQQFLKLGYSYICKKKYYLSWDSDTIPLSKLAFFESQGKPYLDVLPLVKEDKAYNYTIQNLWPDQSVKKNGEYSFITEHMMFSTEIVRKMLNEIESNLQIPGEFFFEKIINAIPISELNLSGFSEFETYSAYITTKYNDLYKIRRWNNLRHGKVFFGCNPTDSQLAWANSMFDVISLEDFDKQWFICKVLCSEKLIPKYSFKLLYELIDPILEFTFNFRLFIRRIIRK